MATSTNSVKANGKMPDIEHNLHSMVDTVSEFGRDLVETSEEKIKVGVKYAKKYPIHTAVGAGILGFAIGFLTKSLR